MNTKTTRALPALSLSFCGTDTGGERASHHSAGKRRDGSVKRVSEHTAEASWLAAS